MPNELRNIKDQWPGRRKEPMPEITAEMVFKWASEGLQRKQMAGKVRLHMNTFNRIVTSSKELQIAELKGKIKFLD